MVTMLTVIQYLFSIDKHDNIRSVKQGYLLDLCDSIHPYPVIYLAIYFPDDYCAINVSDLQFGFFFREYVTI